MPREKQSKQYLSSALHASLGASIKAKKKNQKSLPTECEVAAFHSVKQIRGSEGIVQLTKELYCMCMAEFS